jgi:hypothetical protein
MPVIKDIKYGQDNSIDNAPVLTPEEEHALKARMATMDKLLSEKGLAKYKLEIQFERKRSVVNPTFGIMSFWESGTKLHGGGDTRIYICPSKDRKMSDCEAFIPDSSAGYGFLVCPKCKHTWQGPDVLGEVGARLTMQNWAVLIHKYFMRLEGNADIYVKYPKHDIRVLAAAEQQKQLNGDELAKLRRDQQRCIYPLKNIITDVSNGADLLSKFYAFLRA